MSLWPPGVSPFTQQQIHQTQAATNAAQFNILSSLIGGIALGSAGRLATTSAPLKELPKELVAGPLIAYRSWKIVLGTGLLHSTGVQGSWPAVTPFPARCSYLHLTGGIAPHPGCACGWYAMRKPIPGIHEALGPVYGEVALWGKVIAHEYGYRAEYAWPIRVFFSVPMPGFPIPPSTRNELRAIADNYGCEVIIGGQAPQLDESETEPRS